MPNIENLMLPAFPLTRLFDIRNSKFDINNYYV